MTRKTRKIARRTNTKSTKNIGRGSNAARKRRSAAGRKAGLASGAVRRAAARKAAAKRTPATSAPLG